jgi:hypothetical protein
MTLDLTDGETRAGHPPAALEGPRNSGRSSASAVVVRSILWGALFLSFAPVAAGGQPDPDAAYSAGIEAICRQYAAALVGMPAGPAFDQCMSERHCSASPGSPGWRCAEPGPMAWHGGGY